MEAIDSRYVAKAESDRSSEAHAAYADERTKVLDIFRREEQSVRDEHHRTVPSPEASLPVQREPRGPLPGPAPKARRIAVPARQPQPPAWHSFGCLIVLAGLVAVGAGISFASNWITDLNRPCRQTAVKTEANGLDRCEEVILDKAGRAAQLAVDKSVMPGILYKATVRSQNGSKLSRWECRLEWTGSTWSVDVLTHTDLRLP